MVLSISSSTLSLYSWAMKTCLALRLISNSWVIFLSVWIVLNSPTCLKVLEMLKWLRYYTNVNSQLFFFTVSVYMCEKEIWVFFFVLLTSQNKTKRECLKVKKPDWLNVLKLLLFVGDLWQDSWKKRRVWICDHVFGWGSWSCCSTVQWLCK